MQDENQKQFNALMNASKSLSVNYAKLNKVIGGKD
jgi:hypothetical protein